MKPYMGFSRARRLALSLLTLIILSLTASSAQARAAAAVGPIAGPISAPGHVMPSTGASDPLLYHGGAVLHDPALSLVYWAPAGHSYPTGYQTILGRFLTDVDAASAPSAVTGNVFTAMSEYYDATSALGSHVSAGTSMTDTNTFPSSGCAPSQSGYSYTTCLTIDQIATELDAYLGSASRGDGHIYALVLPPSVDVCQDGTSTSCESTDFCAFHTWMSLNFGETLLEVIPYPQAPCWASYSSTPNSNVPADNVTDYISHETDETLTDPDGQGWYGITGLDDEVADKCAWNFGALTQSPVPNFNQTLNSGHYLLQQEWSNAIGGCTQVGATVPQPTITGSSTGTTGQTISFSSSSSIDPGGTIKSYLWTFGDGSTSTAVNPSHVYSAASTYTVTLTLTDASGASASTSATVVIATTSGLIARLTPSSRQIVLANRAVLLNAAGSSTNATSITNYSWNFGDGSGVVSGPSDITAAHTYTTGGPHTATLTVTDSTGATSMASVLVVVDATLQAAITKPASFTAGTPVLLSAGASTDSSATITSYSWDFGDGQTATAPQVAHVYSAAGPYTITLTLTDSEGQISQITESIFVIASTGTVAQFAPATNEQTSLVVGQSATFDGSASTAAYGTTLYSYRWNFGDRVVGTGVVTTHTYAAPGTYRVALTVTDSNGGTSTAAMNVTVTEPSAPAPITTVTTTNQTTVNDSTTFSTSPGVLVRLGAPRVAAHRTLLVAYNNPSRASARIVVLVELAPARKGGAVLIVASIKATLKPGARGSLTIHLNAAQSRVIAHRGHRALTVTYRG